jgi:hypothetical protein
VGAWHLHRLTQEMSLDFFVLFSSAGALLGSIGQGNYTAANTFLDSLAHHRRRNGLSALSINWGPWAEVGMTAALADQHRQRWDKQGMGTIGPEQGGKVLKEVLNSSAPQIGVLPINWPAYLRSHGRRRLPPFLQEIADQAQPHRPARALPAYEPEILQALAGAAEGERQDVLLSYIRDQARMVLALDASLPIHDQRPLGELGLDSLMAIELRTRLAMHTGVTLSVAELLQGHSLSQIAATILAQLTLADSVKPVAEPDQEPRHEWHRSLEWEVLEL